MKIINQLFQPLNRSFGVISLVILCSFLIVSCGSNQPDNPEYYVDVNGEKIPIIRLDLLEDSATNIPLSIMFEDIRIVPLETKPGCLIAHCDYIMTDHSVLTAARNYGAPIRLYEFDLNGNFIREFGGVGKGPGEHTGYMAGRVTWFPEDELVMASFYGGPDEEHLYSETGDFIQSIAPLGDMFGGILRYSDDLFMTAGPLCGVPRYKRDSFQLVMFRSNGEWVSSFPRHNYPPTGQTGFTSYGGYSFWRYNNSWRLHSAGNDTLYQVSPQALKTVGIFNFGQNYPRYNQFVDPQSEVGRYSIDIMCETNRYLYIKREHLYKLEAKEWRPGQWSAMHYYNYSLMLYDKTESIGYNLRFEDDILGILPFETIQMEQTWDEFGSVIRIAQAVDVLEWIEEAKTNNSLPDGARNQILELENSINENSNPVMFIFKELGPEKLSSNLEKYFK